MIILSNALLRGEFDLTNLIIITIPIPYLFAHDPIKITLYLIALNLITQIIGLMILSIDQNELFSYILVCIIIGVSSSY